MDPAALHACSWPITRLGDALAALGREAGLARGESHVRELGNPPADANHGAWVEWAARKIGFEAEPFDLAYRDLESGIESAFPALLRISETAVLAIVRVKGARMHVLTPGLVMERLPLPAVCDAIRRAMDGGVRKNFEELLARTSIPARRRAAALRVLAGHQLGDKPFGGCWILRSAPGERFRPWLKQANAAPNASALVAAHLAQYLLWLASWAILGRLSLAGRMDRGWLFAWALLLMALIPFRIATTWLQGLLAIGIGGIMKRRLLVGAMRLGPEEMRARGIGSFLGQVLEAESVETVALNGGIAGALAVVELAVASIVLGRLAILAGLCFFAIAGFGWRFMRAYRKATLNRMQLTQDLVEAMVGHRTRLAQQPRNEWHETEDQALETYFGLSRWVDNIAVFLVAAVPRVWLLLGLAGIAPQFVSGQNSPTATAVALGGVLLAFTAFKRLSSSFADIAAAWVACERIAPLFRSAARPESLGQAAPRQKRPNAAKKLIEADHLSYKYRKDGDLTLRSCSLTVKPGERILLEGPSGGGKTTFASLLSGFREPCSGLLLINGLDRHSIGADRWREHVASAPQFHENHILTETLAFNLLMGRNWPPTQRDMAEAEAICRELGLAGLLERMPSGLMQMVGEGGWQLSHGERSRVYIARALLQDADLIVLDESFAALDPENLRVALECTLRRAKTLMVIAHP